MNTEVKAVLDEIKASVAANAKALTQVQDTLDRALLVTSPPEVDPRPEQPADPPPVVVPPPPVVTLPPVVAGEPDLGTLPAPASTRKISINGKDFIDAAGNVVVPRGVNFSGFAFVAVQGWSPADPSGGQGGQANGPKYSAMVEWGANIVRFDLNEASWLGYSCTDTDGLLHNPDPGKNYKTAVKTQVDAARAAGLYVILDLHWTAPGTTCPMLQTQMADADHSLDFWASIANTFKNYPDVMFELFNEPFLNFDFSGDPWAYMMKGTGGSFSGYPATSTKGTWRDVKKPWKVASYQQMINAVRATGATNVVLVGTMQYSQDFSRWLASKPTDPLNQMAAAFHPYPTYGAPMGSAAAAQPNFAPQVFTDAEAILAAGIPVIATETGDHNAPGTVGSPLVSTVTQWADANGVGVLGWTWDVWADPDNVLIKDVNGTPTDGYGQVFRAWLESHKASAPPVVVDPPPVVTLVGQTLTAAQDTFSVGDTFAVIGTLNYSDGSTGPASSYRLYDFDTAVLQHPGEAWDTTFTAIAEGSTTIRNDNHGTTGTLEVVVKGVGNPPINTTKPDPGDPTAPTAPTGGVYAAALAAMGPLPLASAWSETRPAYTASVELTLTDGTALTVDTSSQGPDYVPYAGVWIYPLMQSDGTRHPDLSLTCYADCVMIGNTWVDAAASYTGHHSISINGAVVEDVDSRYDFACYTTPCRAGLPQPTPSNNWDSSLTPNYATVPGGYTPFTSQVAKADNSINGRSLTTPSDGMGMTGQQLSIGILHGAMIPYVVDGGEENWVVVMTIEDHARGWPIHLRDRVTGLPASPSLPHCIDVTLLDVFITSPNMGGGHVNPVRVRRTSPMNPDESHTPGFGIVSALATGSISAIEEAIFWGAYESLWQNPAYRHYGDGISRGQVRGVAWQNRSKAYAAKLCPVDHPLHAGLQNIVAANAAHLTEKYVGPDAKYGNPYGIMGGEGSFAYIYAGMDWIGMAPWQNDFNAAVVHQIIRMGFPGWDGFMGFLNRYTKGRMGDGSAGALWWTTAAFYSNFPRILGSYASETALRAEYVADWEIFNNQNLTYVYSDHQPVGIVGPYADQVGQTIETADFGDGPGVARAISPNNTDFWANLQPALAALADTGDGDAEWALYATHVLPPKDYHGGGQFNIVPGTK